MKKIILLILILAIANKSNAQQFVNILEENEIFSGNYPLFIFPYKHTLKGNVQEIVEERFTANLQNGKVINKQNAFYDKIITVLNEQQKKVSVTKINPKNKLHSETSFKYENNLKQKVTTINYYYDSLDILTYTDTTYNAFYYNDKRQLIQNTRFIKASNNDNGWMNPYSNYYYYTPQNKVAYIIENTNRVTEVYAYDKLANCTRITQYGLDDYDHRTETIYWQKVFAYDATNRCIMRHDLQENNNSIKYNYNYDNKNNVVKYLETYSGEQFGKDTTSVSIVYDKYGNCISAHFKKGIDEMRDTSTYTFDHQKNWISCTIHTGDSLQIIERKIKYK